jgi:hypothetical protein
VEVFDVTGRKIRTLAHRLGLGAGVQDLVWDGADHLGVPLKRGVYLVRLSAEGRILTRKHVVLR